VRWENLFFENRCGVTATAKHIVDCYGEPRFAEQL